MKAVVEFQGFKDNNNRFIVKELAITGDSFQCHLLFKPPYNFEKLNSKMRRTARWLTRHYHCIRWEDGTLPYDENLIRTLCMPFNIIYTKGNEKADFLQMFHSNVRDVSVISIEKCNVRCMHPLHGSTHDKCALRRACMIYDYINQNPEFDAPVRNGERLDYSLSRAKVTLRGDD